MGKIEDQIPVDLKAAMLAKDKVKLAALRARVTFKQKL